MKRSLRIITSFIVMAGMIFLSGWTGTATVARAEGFQANGLPHWNSSTTSFHNNPKVSALISRASIAKTAANTIEIKSNTTVTSKTYNGNVLVDQGVTLTVGTNGKVVINGDLYIVGTIKIPSGTVTVNGNVISTGSISVSGSGKININKAAAGNTSQSNGGNLINAGTMVMTGSGNITINKVTGQLGFMNMGYFTMNSSSAKMTVNGACFFDGYSTSGKLTAGSLIVNGDFVQGADYSEYSFCPNPAFSVTIIGTTTTPRMVAFASPSGSYFTKYTFTNVVFTSDSNISLKINLSANSTITFKIPYLFVQGTMNGHALTVNASYPSAKAYFYPGYGSSLVLGGGTLTVNASSYLDIPCKLVMSNTNDKYVSNGAFLAASDYTANLTAGCLELHGDFYQVTNDNNNTKTFVPGPNFIVRVVGTGRGILFVDPGDSYFTNLALASGATLKSTSIVCLNQNLTADTTWSFPGLYYRGNLNGHKLQITGRVTIPYGCSVFVNKGVLNVTGSMVVEGKLIMTYSADTVTVGGNYVSMGQDSTGKLADGKLFIVGNFAQSGEATSFRATGNHMTILNGKSAQTVTFANGSKTSGSTFAHLVVLNDSLSTSAIPKFYTDLVVSGTSLAGIASDKGTLSPAYMASTTAYKLFLSGTNSCVITPSLPSRYTNASMTIDGVDNATGKVITGLPYSSSKTVTIVVHAYNDLAQKTYTVKAEILCPYLGSLNLPTGSYCDPAFATKTTSYAVNLPATAASFQWSPKPYNPDASVTIDGSPAPITVTAAVNTPSKTYTVHVIQQDGTPGVDYTVVFTRKCPVSNITVSAGTLTFDPAKASYAVTIPSTASSVTLNVAKNATGSNGVIQINGTAATKITVPLAAGASQVVTIKAWDSAGKAVTTYTVTVKRAAS